MNYRSFDSNVTEICSRWLRWSSVVGWGNELVLNCPQTSTWINCKPVHWVNMSHQASICKGLYINAFLFLNLSNVISFCIVPTSDHPAKQWVRTWRSWRGIMIHFNVFCQIYQSNIKFSTTRINILTYMWRKQWWSTSFCVLHWSPRINKPWNMIYFASYSWFVFTIWAWWIFGANAHDLITSWHGNAICSTGPLWWESRWIWQTKCQQCEALAFFLS